MSTEQTKAPFTVLQVRHQQPLQAVQVTEHNAHDIAAAWGMLTSRDRHGVILHISSVMSARPSMWVVRSPGDKWNRAVYVADEIGKVFSIVQDTDIPAPAPDLLPALVGALGALTRARDVLNEDDYPVTVQNISAAIADAQKAIDAAQRHHPSALGPPPSALLL
jgi:hypothetical protein